MGVAALMRIFGERSRCGLVGTLGRLCGALAKPGSRVPAPVLTDPGTLLHKRSTNAMKHLIYTP